MGFLDPLDENVALVALMPGLFVAVLGLSVSSLRGPLDLPSPVLFLVTGVPILGYVLYRGWKSPYEPRGNVTVVVVGLLGLFYVVAALAPSRYGAEMQVPNAPRPPPAGPSPTAGFAFSTAGYSPRISTDSSPRRSYRGPSNGSRTGRTSPNRGPLETIRSPRLHSTMPSSSSSGRWTACKRSRLLSTPAISRELDGCRWRSRSSARATSRVTPDSLGTGWGSCSSRPSNSWRR